MNHSSNVGCPLGSAFIKWPSNAVDASRPACGFDDELGEHSTLDAAQAVDTTSFPMERMDALVMSMLAAIGARRAYEHTRSRNIPGSERLPYVKVGKYVRFEPRALRGFIEKRCRTTT